MDNWTEKGWTVSYVSVTRDEDTEDNDGQELNYSVYIVGTGQDGARAGRTVYISRQRAEKARPLDPEGFASEEALTQLQQAVNDGSYRSHGWQSVVLLNMPFQQ